MYKELSSEDIEAMKDDEILLNIEFGLWVSQAFWEILEKPTIGQKEMEDFVNVLNASVDMYRDELMKWVVPSDV